jgi:hypothetical protein
VATAEEWKMQEERKRQLEEQRRLEHSFVSQCRRLVLAGKEWFQENNGYTQNGYHQPEREPQHQQQPQQQYRQPQQSYSQVISLSDVFVRIHNRLDPPLLKN